MTRARTPALFILFVHDAHLGGVDIAETGLQSPKCGNNNEPLDKAAAARILGHILTK